jgi:hypothetical protein
MKSLVICPNFQIQLKKPPWSESASELHRPSDRRLSAKWLPTISDRGCHVVSVTDPYTLPPSTMTTCCFSPAYNCRYVKLIALNITALKIGAPGDRPPISIRFVAWRLNTETIPSKKLKNQTPWPESAGEIYLPSERRLSAKWLPTFAYRGCHVVSVTDPYGRILGFLDRSRYFSIK